MVRATPKVIERRFIRHPSRVPISYDLPDGDDRHRDEALRNVSDGGVCFFSREPLEQGATIRLRVPVFSDHFEADGTVAWCRHHGNGFEIGVAFASEQDRFAVRMVEQLCYIEEYRARVEREQGRSMSSEQAAAEWVARFAGEFPDLR